MKRFLRLLESLLTGVQNVLPMPLAVWAGEHYYYQTVNALRKRRFGVRCYDCQGCGYAFPLRELKLVTKADGKIYPECQKCIAFGKFIRAALGEVA